MTPPNATKNRDILAQRLSYTRREFSDLTGIPYQTVWARCAAGAIPTIDFGGSLVIPADFVRNKFMAAARALIHA